MKCTGCGRPVGIPGEAMCPCWLSYSENAIIPARLVARTKEVRRLREQKRK